MAIAQSIFILNGWFQLFWAAFDMALTFLESCHRIEKIDFWVFQKNNHLWPLDNF